MELTISLYENCNEWDVFLGAHKSHPGSYSMDLEGHVKWINDDSYSMIVSPQKCNNKQVGAKRKEL